ncbi:aspartate/glutamate/uridylate kinase [Pseudonocardia sp. Ae168_Ps1]|uniref:amino acid kinase family protein n=1 Tax=unclassified Pseudonocardia TaxID=2619320 RepID=UPI0001FFE907|nr:MULTISPECIES: molybdenum storage protein subunit alpha [unclassified Pseudonocardia]OLL72693.1 aspartate/glutamate/uridylate kinase [Pseudonocardia sp. Ae150A_Ps1]OLL78664.1 aspartate/glutamate/uridylate kinase [Pseudonocardia sp. Ae168_Ps1]OLL87207.1 aspartate/glutamate/uridylate kinase [Pseudonocardia sp. Ae263_Ps1]OLL92763.1 aspartate/glutamate/uridylate kinase [Pseudonocardia sp. Ae356_Ps1]OLM19240.1 aspartate/glutamate/uridylate kinase [Pseudonocardia sp. Ae707_Ps1]
MSTTYTKDVESALARQTLMDREQVRPVDQQQPVIRMLPTLRVVVLGGRSVIDRGRDVLLPLVDEIRAALDGDPLLLATGAGIRARHALGVGLDLGLPTGALAELAGREAEQNGHLVAALLADRGVAYLGHDTVAHQLPVHLAASNAAVTNGFPPFGVHEFPAATGKIPPHRTDTGALLLADAWGAASLTYVRDVPGVLDGDDVVGSVTAAELLADPARGLPVDREALVTLQRAKHVRSFQVVDGTVPGTLTRALAGEHVGTVVSA